MAPPTPPLPPGSPAPDCDFEPQADRLASPSSSPGDNGVGLDAVGRQVVGEERSIAPTLTAEDAGRRPIAEVPFAWQHGQRLLLLDQEASGWTFAELRFDNVDCRYVELRRATFLWPREAAGALLARALAFGSEPAERLAGALDRWLSAHLSAVDRSERAAG